MGNNKVTRKKAAGLAKFDYGEKHEGQGYENQTQADIAIPFLTILEPLSPQIETIVDAKPGLLFNTVTGELLEDTLFVPITTQHVFVEWVPRKRGGGFVAVHGLQSDVVAKARADAVEFGKYQTPAKNDLVETFYIFGALCDEKEVSSMIVLSMSSTKIKTYKRYNTRLNTFMLTMPDGSKKRPPLYAHLTRITVVKEKNIKGDFHNFVLEPANTNIKDSLLAMDDPRFLAAADYKTIIDEGAVRIAYETASDDGEGEEKPPF